MKIKNTEELSVGDMTADMVERKPLPIGRKQFEEWSDRIIAGALVEATTESLKFSLAAMLMHIGSTEAFKEDAFFILSLRKAAVNQTAHAMMEEMKLAQQARKEEKEAQKIAEDTAPTNGAINGAVLENQGV